MNTTNSSTYKNGILPKIGLVFLALLVLAGIIIQGTGDILGQKPNRTEVDLNGQRDALERVMRLRVATLCEKQIGPIAERLEFSVDQEKSAIEQLVSSHLWICQKRPSPKEQEEEMRGMKPWELSLFQDPEMVELRRQYLAIPF